MSIYIDDVKPEDLTQIEALEQNCFSCPWSMHQLATQIKNNNHEFIAAYDENGIVLGYIGLMYVLDEGYISNVAVSPEYRRRGIAQKLVSAMKQKATEHELSFLTLEVREGNVAARELYSKLDFVEVGKRKSYYEQPKEDAILMTFYLK